MNSGGEVVATSTFAPPMISTAIHDSSPVTVAIAGPAALTAGMTGTFKLQLLLSLPTTTTTLRVHHRRAQQVVAQTTAKQFPRWAIGGFALAGVLIISGLAGFVFTRTRP